MKNEYILSVGAGENQLTLLNEIKKLNYLVISCDLDLLAQVKPGDLIKFEAISLEKAVQAKKDWVHSIKELNYTDERRHYKIGINESVYDVYVEEI